MHELYFSIDEQEFLVIIFVNLCELRILQNLVKSLIKQSLWYWERIWTIRRFDKVLESLYPAVNNIIILHNDLSL